MGKIDLDSIYVPSEDVVAREIEGEIVIVPLTAGIGDAEDDLFALNETGRALWKLMDGKNKVQQIIDSLVSVYDGPETEIETDVQGLLEELLGRGIIQEKR